MLMGISILLALANSITDSVFLLTVVRVSRGQDAAIAQADDRRGDGMS